MNHVDVNHLKTTAISWISIIVFEYVRVMLCNTQNCLQNQKWLKNTRQFSRRFHQKEQKFL